MIITLTGPKTYIDYTYNECKDANDREKLDKIIFEEGKERLIQILSYRKEK